jgi:hypothetical protein
VTRVSVLAAILLASACSHAEAPALASLDEPERPPTDDAPAPFGVVGVDEDESDDEVPSADDPNVISFEEDVDAGPTDTIAAPPKRKHIPSFELFGTAKTRGDDEGPKMTLPDDVE